MLRQGTAATLLLFLLGGCPIGGGGEEAGEGVFFLDNQSSHELTAICSFKYGRGEFGSDGGPKEVVAPASETTELYSDAMIGGVPPPSDVFESVALHAVPPAGGDAVEVFRVDMPELGDDEAWTREAQDEQRYGTVHFTLAVADADLDFGP